MMGKIEPESPIFDGKKPMANPVNFPQQTNPVTSQTIQININNHILAIY